jgi:uncharacterized membrane protein
MIDMRNYFTIKTLLALACFALVSTPLPVVAQTSNADVSIFTSPSTVTRGGSVAVFSRVTNTGTSKMRTNVTITTVSPCGSQTVLGVQRLSLDAGESVNLSVAYSVPANACTGMYAFTISADSGKAPGKNAAAVTSTATAYVEVQ